jgi:DNA repair exonuclease SbcCD nuclease subunit
MGNYENVFYADKELGYTSGCIKDDNIVWCLYSSFDDFNRPQDLEYTKTENPNSTFVGLFHGEVNGAKTDAGYVFERGFGGEYFSDMDFVCAGHIHKCQEIKKNGVKIVYSSSLIQQDYGENVSGHGFVIWNVEKGTWKHKEIKNSDHGFFKVVINSDTDLKEDKEIFLNL